MAIDPVTSTALKSLVQDALPDIQRRFAGLAAGLDGGPDEGLDGGPLKEHDIHSMRHALANTLDLLAIVGVWLSEGAPEQEQPVVAIQGTKDESASVSTAGHQVPPRVNSLDLKNQFLIPIQILDGLSEFGDLLEADQLRLRAVSRVAHDMNPEAPFVSQLTELAAQVGDDVAGLRRILDTITFRDSSELETRLEQSLAKVVRESGLRLVVEKSFSQFKVDHAHVDDLAESLAGAAIAMGVVAAGAGVTEPRIRLDAARKGGILQFRFSLFQDASIDVVRSLDLDPFIDMFESVKAVVYRESSGLDYLIVEMPASLKSMKGIVVQSAGETYALPVHGIIETIRIDTNRVQIIGGQEYLNFRSSSLPLVPLADVLGKVDESGNPNVRSQSGTRYALVIQSGGRRFGLTVDQLVQHRELAVRPLGGSLARRRTVMGGAIDSDGRVILVLDPRQVRTAIEKGAA